MSSDSVLEKNNALADNASKSSESLANDNQIPTYLGLKGQKLNTAISTMCGVGFLLFGYDQGVMGSLLTLPAFREAFPTIDLELNPQNDTLQGFTVAVYELGCMASALSTIYLGDRLGRLKTMLLGVAIMFVGGILQAASVKSVAFLIVARIVTGVGNGFNTATVPVYQSETSKAHNRGMLICFEGCLITLGIAISYWVDFAFYFTKGQISWRFPIAFQCVFPMIMFPFILKLPESPRLLMSKGNVHEARRVFASLYDVPVNDHLIDEQIREIEEVLSIERQASAGGNSSLFSQGEKRNFQRTCLAAFCQFMQQICGINLITYYAGTIFEVYIGMPPLESRILAACNGTEYFIASIITIFIIERVGRRPLFIWGTAGQCLTMVCLSITIYLAKYKDSDSAAIGAAFLLFAFNTFFALSLLSLTWLYSPEVSSLTCRAATSGVSTAANWVTNFLVVMIAPIMFQRIEHYTYATFAVINFLMIPVFYFLYPETKRRSLEEMDVIFTMTPKWQPWKSVQIARTLPYIHAGAVDDVEAKMKEFIEHREIS
ncbi:putative sugar transporter [Hyphopichia burtonii NRRL Y-1933]|uniref:Putative sugar transporter n=1 Tax=Hyphopichia burtonii NRRL Y-1933 TaxID=984485 RepID=A0A1E4RLB0_9ASCO|nr:putative sugar transporter [Hyphopichia burtonii NRRL Y-1933]ODV68050.1 putative sugar transporter [Hyphopichia burtonii NRRL Y-1933]